MEWAQILTMIGANLAAVISMFLWARREAGEDRKESTRQHDRALDIIQEIQKEMKDFHGRLCSIEEKISHS